VECNLYHKVGKLQEVKKNPVWKLFQGQETNVQAWLCLEEITVSKSR
jgi:hypothetical protein